MLEDEPRSYNYEDLEIQQQGKKGKDKLYDYLNIEPSTLQQEGQYHERLSDELQKLLAHYKQMTTDRVKNQFKQRLIIL